MTIIELLLLAISLCADCFAVSLCSSVTLKEAKARDVVFTALAFAVIQSGLLILGWLFGNVFVGLVEKISNIIGFALLLYVGGSMLYGGIKGESESRNLNGMRNVILAGIATSIDALAVGISQSMGGLDTSHSLWLTLFVFIFTVLSVVSGINAGKTIGCMDGRRYSRAAELAGGAILIGIGVSILL